MKRPLLPLAVALLAGTALLSACDPGRPAATVGSSSIDADDVLGDLAVEAATPAAQPGPGGPNPLASPQGASPGTFRATSAAAALTNRIRDLVVADELERNGVEVTDQDREQARQRLCATTDPATGQPMVPAGDECPALDAYPADYRDALIGRDARLASVSRVLQERVSQDPEAAYQRVLERDPESIRQICYVVAVTPDQAVAERLVEAAAGEATLEDAAAGAPGTQIAPEQSCDLASSFAGEAALIVDTPVGDVAGPITSASGFAVAEVIDRPLLPADDPQVAQAILSAEVARIFADADIEVDPRFGRWDPDTLSVVGGEPSDLPVRQATTIPTGVLGPPVDGG